MGIIIFLGVLFILSLMAAGRSVDAEEQYGCAVIILFVLLVVVAISYFSQHHLHVSIQ